MTFAMIYQSEMNPFVFFSGSRSSGLFLFIVLLTQLWGQQVKGQQTLARQWNEALLFSISNDFARPTIHARNLFHISAAMYDAWAVYDDVSETYLIGKTVHGFSVPFDGVPQPQDLAGAREMAISYAAYRMLRHRFINSPGAFPSYLYYDSLMNALGLPTNVISIDYTSGNPAHLGNYIASRYISYGHQDGANEMLGFINSYYEPYNNPLAPQAPGNPDCIDANRWQPLAMTTFIDQAGNIIPGGTPPFLSPEWGNVNPFSLTENEMETYEREGHNWNVYLDPGPPCLMDTANVDELGSLYQWNFALVSVWQSHLDTADGVMWDISPATIGNIQEYPTSIFDHPEFYDLFEGGDPSIGYNINPKTGLPYEPQWVRRGDYARVLAEFWADGPNSYTPPGHWFEILNKVGDYPLFEKRFMGEGDIMPDLEWDVKAYFTLGGAMHDAAMAAWSVKGYYDYLRPISAIRFMGEIGQSTDPEFSNYHPAGLPLMPGYIEVVEEGDPLAADSVELVGKIKLYTWRGHEYVDETETDMAGVGWILAERWWPYQRISFVTPPFAGYISGHSTFSRTAAEVMTRMTGDPFFPGGMSEFTFHANEYLEFEAGPSGDVNLQWATYRDASDQCSLSRIWGGIHPPVDDIPGRHIGMVIGPQAVDFARTYFGEQLITDVPRVHKARPGIYPNPASDMAYVSTKGISGMALCEVIDLNGRKVSSHSAMLHGGSQSIGLDVNGLTPGVYVVRLVTGGTAHIERLVVSR